MIGPFAPAQGRPATVGDTVWVTRVVAVPAGYTVRPADWTPADPMEAVGPAQVLLRGDSAVIAYPLTAWRAGHHRLEVPGPLLLGPAGQVDSLPATHASIAVTSVLPPAAAETALAPQPRAALVPLTTSTPVPLTILWALAALVLVPLHLRWRRRGPAPPLPPRIEPAPAVPPLERWTEAGEARAVVAHAAARLRRAVATASASTGVASTDVASPDVASTDGVGAGSETATLLEAARRAYPAWPHSELAQLFGELDRARFGPTDPDALTLAHQSEALARRLTREET